MNTKRLRADKSVAGKLLRLAGKRHRELVQGFYATIMRAIDLI